MKDRLEEGRLRALQSPWIARIARSGYVAKGFVYIIAGGLAVSAAFGARRRASGMRSALNVMVRQPYGTVLVTAVALGLSLYVLWRLVQAVLDPEHKGTSLRGLVQRGAYAVSALIFANLTWDAVEIAVGWGQGKVDAAEDWTALVLAQPLGRWGVAVGGALVIGTGLYQLYQAYTARFQQKFDSSKMSMRAETWVRRIGRFGYAARSVVFTIIGVFLIVAALRVDSERAAGLAEVLLTLADQPFGSWVMAAVASGLIAHGLYTIAEARYRRIG